MKAKKQVKTRQSKQKKTNVRAGRALTQKEMRRLTEDCPGADPGELEACLLQSLEEMGKLDLLG
jgi:hypothetical protein